MTRTLLKGYGTQVHLTSVVVDSVLRPYQIKDLLTGNRFLLATDRWNQMLTRKVECDGSPPLTVSGLLVGWSSVSSLRDVSEFLDVQSISY